MKKLYLLRHAKSSWEFNVDDHQRPLNERGHEDAALIGAYLKAEQLEFQRILCSTAVRTQETAKIVLAHLTNLENAFSSTAALYDFEGTEVVNVIKNIPDTIQDVLIIGHNNALTNIANGYGNRKISNISTCGLVSIEFDCEKWTAIAKGETIFSIFPKELR